MWAIAIAVLSILLLLLAWRRSGRPAIDYFGMLILHVYVRLWHRLSSRGGSAVPAQGGVLLAANHTASSDPAFISHASPRLPGYLIAKEYYEIPWGRRLLRYMGCVPTARNGCDVQATRLALRQLSGGGVLGIFPEGNLSNAGRRRPRPGKPGVAYLALKSRAAVVPVLIRGGPQTSHILPAWLRPSRKCTRVTFGPAIDLSPYHGRPLDRRLLEEVTALVMRRIEELDQAASCSNLFSPAAPPAAPAASAAAADSTP